jgi:hypothetical protein
VKGTTVIHNLAGGQYTKDGIETAWQRACVRAGIKDAHFHDLREIKISALGLKLPAASNSDALKSADTPDKPATNSANC